MFQKAQWITTPSDYGSVCPVFQCRFTSKKAIRCATISISALGCYIAKINKKRIGSFILAPGWTSYDTRLQVQEYDITHQIQNENTLEITAGPGWYHSGMSEKRVKPYASDKIAIICEIKFIYEDNTVSYIHSGKKFQVRKSQILKSNIYDGEIYDARPSHEIWEKACTFLFPKDMLIPQDGPSVIEMERLAPISVKTSYCGDFILDFGQNISGYVEFTSYAPSGHIIEIRHGEILKNNGNVYTENLRNAQQRVYLIGNGSKIIYKPHFTFQGFRYIQVIGWVGTLNPEDFTAIVVHSDIKRTGYFTSSHPKLNRLFENIVWSQKGNFLDIPTDCPQRDERLGWTGDAQTFIKTAAYNFDVERFFTKWLRDLKAEQFEDGGVPAVIPNVMGKYASSSAGWGDAAVICPWQLYLFYGKKEILEQHFESMKKWVLYVKSQGSSRHYGDWLALDAKPGGYEGATPKDLIATAYFAYSTSLFIRIGKILKKDMSEFETLYREIKHSFQTTYIKNGELTCRTQTAHVLTLAFDLADMPSKIAQGLVHLIAERGNKLSTGFIGTPYLLPALSKAGYHQLAYTLLLQEEFPSWLYSVNQGATTIWEHWDGIDENGKLWSADMNSFNHYAYGAVGGWMYETMAGIRIDEERPGFQNIIFAPITDQRLDYVKASVKTGYGTVSSQWQRKNGKIQYTFVVPAGCTADILIGGEVYHVKSGTHTWEILEDD